MRSGARKAHDVPSAREVAEFDHLTAP